MRLPRFSLLQLLMAAALCGLVLGLFLAAHRMKAYSDISSIRYSKSGKFLAARYYGGAIQVWDVAGSRPRLVGQSEATNLLDFYESGSLEFIGDRLLLDISSRSLDSTNQLRGLDLKRGAWRTVLRDTDHLGVSTASDDMLALISYRSGAPHADIYDVDRGRRILSFPLHGQVYALAMTADSSLLVTYDGTDTCRSYDVATGKPLAKIVVPAGSYYADLNHDGALLACLSNDGLMELYDPRSGKKVSELPATGWRWLEFTADGRRIAGASNHIFEVYEPATLKRISGWHREPLGRSSALIDIGSSIFLGFTDQSLALSPDGKTLATFDNGRIGLWDASNGNLRSTMAGGSRMIHIILFTLGFALWAAAWGIVSKRERLRRPGPLGPAVPPINTFKQPRPAPKVVSPWWQLGKPALWLAGLIIGLYCFINADELQSTPMTVVLWAVLWTVSILIVIIALLVIYTRAMTYLCGPYYWTIARLQAITADPGRRQRRGNLLGWFVGISSIESMFAARYNAIANRMSEFFGQPFDLDKLLIVGLDRQCDYDALFHMHVTAGGVAVKNMNPPVVVVCEQTCTDRLSSPTTQLDGALLLVLTTVKYGGYLPAWVAATLSLHLIKDDDQAAMVQAAFRRMKLQLSCYPQWDCRSALTRSTLEFGKLRLQTDEPESFYAALETIDVYTTMAEYLLGAGAPADRRQRARDWLRESRPGDDVAVTFRKHLGNSLEEMIAEWRLWVIAQPPSEPIAPSAAMREAIHHLLRRHVRYPAPWTADRDRAVRALGAAGFLEGADTLIALLDPAYSAKHRDVVRALESISGLPLHDDVAAWEAWWQSMQALVIEPVIEAAIVDETNIVATGEGETPNESVSQRLSAPADLKACWAFMVVGGLVALALPISVLFTAGPLIFPTMYFALLVGVAALSRGAARDTSGLANIAIMQTASLLACDPVNFVLGVLNQYLLKRPGVRRYLHQANGGRL